MSNDSNILNNFFILAEEHIQDIEDDLFKLEKGNITQDIINNIFRNIHTIKGDSASLGLNDIKELSHLMENILDDIRSGDIRITRNFIDIMFDSTKVLQKYILKKRDKKDIQINDETLIKELKEYKISKTITDTDNDEIFEKDNDQNDIYKENQTVKNDDLNLYKEKNKKHESFVIINILNRNFSLSFKRIVEVIANNIPVTRLPFVEKYISGIINLRGEAVPIIDLGKRLGINNKITERNNILVVSNSSEKCGLIVDNVKKIIKNNELKFGNMNDFLLDFNNKFISNVMIDKNNDIIFSLDLEKILNRNI